MGLCHGIVLQDCTVPISKKVMWCHLFLVCTVRSAIRKSGESAVIACLFGAAFNASSTCNAQLRIYLDSVSIIKISGTGRAGGDTGVSLLAEVGIGCGAISLYESCTGRLLLCGLYEQFLTIPGMVFRS